MMSVAEKIRNLRTFAGITQNELAKLLGVQTNSVTKWEHGQVETIPISKIKTMARIFNVAPSSLIEDDVDSVSAMRKQNL